MIKCKIADLIVDIDSKFNLLNSRLNEYVYNFNEKSCAVYDISKEEIASTSNMYPALNLEESEYMMVRQRIL